MMADNSIYLKEDVKMVTILCPHCKQQSAVDAATNQCVMTIDCPHCHRAIEKTDDGCCVTCSHGVAPSGSEGC